MNKLFIIGLPRTGTTSISVALLEHFKVAHTGYTKRAFEVAEVISDCPCFSDYPHLDGLFPNSKYVYLQRSLEQWIPSIQMLLQKMLPSFNGKSYVNPILRRSFEQTFKLTSVNTPFDESHLARCYQRHEQAVLEYFNGRDDLLKIDLNNSKSLSQLLGFLNLQHSNNVKFPHLNVGKLVDNWKGIKHINKINSNLAGRQGRKFFDYGH